MIPKYRFSPSFFSRTSPLSLAMVGAQALLLAGVLFNGLLDQKPLSLFFQAILPFVPGLCIAVVWTIASAVVNRYMLEIDETEIRLLARGEQKRIRWADLESVDNLLPAGGLKLRNPRSGVIIELNSNIDRFPEVVDWLRSKTLDLWAVPERLEFRTGSYEISDIAKTLGKTDWQMFMVWLCGFASGKGTVEVFLAALASLFFVNVIVAAILLASRSAPPRATVVENDTLRITGRRSEESIKAADVDRITLKAEYLGCSVWPRWVVCIRGKNEKTLASIVDGRSPVVYNYLVTWLQKYKARQAHPQQLPGPG
jgi:hypothetical protein